MAGRPANGPGGLLGSDTGIDGQHRAEIDELYLIPIDPLPPSVWFQDMADCADGISDAVTRRKLTQALQGRGAFRRFKNQLYECHPDPIRSWHSLRDVRAQRRAVAWLADEGLIDDGAAQLIRRHAKGRASRR